MENITQPSIDLPKRVFQLTEIPDKDAEIEAAPKPMDDTSQPQKDWREEILLYIAEGKQPEDKLLGNCEPVLPIYDLQRRTLPMERARVMMRCIHRDEVFKVLHETHEGGGGNHSGVRSLALKTKKLGFSGQLCFQTARNTP